MNVILASKSKRRERLLKKLGLNFKIIDSKLDESNIKFKRPHLYCQKLANMKANLVLEKNPNSLVIGADTIVYVDNKILEKPSNYKEAFNMLKMLSGKLRTLEIICLKTVSLKMGHVEMLSRTLILIC